jgi:branched-chain amino acid transport system ATP-binding protein
MVAAAALLELRQVRAAYGQVRVLHDVSLTVGPGELVALLGANGAGKTTVLRCVSRTLDAQGELTLSGQSIARRSTEAVAQMGVAHVPEGRGTFTDLTVVENLLLGARARARSLRSEMDRDLEAIYGYFPMLAEYRHRPAGLLSGGQQQMLALARALLARPRLLMIDEPSLGLAPMVARDIIALIGRLRTEWSLAVLLVEQNARLALDVADRAYVLQSGRVITSGTASELRKSDLLRSSYLGL